MSGRVLMGIGLSCAVLLVGAGAGWAIVSSGAKAEHPPTAIAVTPAPVESPSDDADLNAGDWEVGKPSPDLVEGRTDEGRVGFLRTYDLMNLPEPSADGDIVINVYGDDGRRKIGTFTAAHVSEENEEKQ